MSLYQVDKNSLKGVLPQGFGEGDRGTRDEMHDRDMYRRAAQEYEKKPVGPGGQDPEIVFVSEFFTACSQLLIFLYLKSFYLLHVQRGGYGRGQPESGGM